MTQLYMINSAKVILLKPRPQSRPFKGSGNVSLTCETILQGDLPLLLSLLQGHLINYEYLSSTNLLLPNFPVGVKQIFSSTYVESCMCVCVSVEVNHVVEQGGNVGSVMR